MRGSQLSLAHAGQHGLTDALQKRNQSTGNTGSKAP